MSSRRPVRQILVAVLLGVLVGGGLMAVTPAGAEVSQAAATSWKKIWKKELKPLAAKSFYTKSKASSTFATKAESTAGDAAASAAASAAANAATDAKLGGYYKKAESDAKYAGAGAGYTKAESDARYAPYAGVVRGVYFMQAAPNQGILNAEMNFGVELSAVPITHYIPYGGAVPVGCAGTVDAPNAAPGHVCVFESGSGNVNGQYVFNPAAVTGGSTTFGAEILGLQANPASPAWFRGTWAMRPATLGSQTAMAPAKPGAVNPGVVPDQAVR